MCLENHVLNLIRSNKLITKNDNIVIGVSGGADSVALLNILHNINQTTTAGFSIHVAHLNHKLRGKESDEDTAFVKQLAHKLNIKVFITEIDIKKLANSTSLSIEECARNERYNFLKSCAKELGTANIAVAHTADDNSETILQRLIRGTGILGLGGIKLKRPIAYGSEIHLIRPLLYTWKKDIIAYLDEKEIAYREDSSNLKKEYYRNKIRLELIPFIEENYNNQIKQALINLSDICNKNDHLIDELYKSLYEDSIVREGCNEYVFNNQKLAKGSEIVLQKLVYHVFTKMNVPLKQVGYKHYNNIVKSIKNNHNSKNIFEFENIRIFNSYDELHFQTLCKKDESEDKKTIGDPVELFGTIELNVPGITELPVFMTKIEAEVIENENGFLKRFKLHKTTNEEVFDIDNIAFPMFVRLRKPGDRFKPIGSKGTKKIKDFFIDNKIPVYDRNKIPIVFSKEHPVWLVGCRIDERVKVSRNSKKVLILRYLETELDQK